MINISTFKYFAWFSLAILVAVWASNIISDFSGVKDHAECEAAIKDWTMLVQSTYPRMRDPANQAFFAPKFTTAIKACPNGHPALDKMPLALRAAADALIDAQH